jgi:hypothetical protein
VSNEAKLALSSLGGFFAAFVATLYGAGFRLAVGIAALAGLIVWYITTRRYR